MGVWSINHVLGDVGSNVECTGKQPIGRNAPLLLLKLLRSCDDDGGGGGDWDWDASGQGHPGRRRRRLLLPSNGKQLLLLLLLPLVLLLPSSSSSPPPLLLPIFCPMGWDCCSVVCPNAHASFSLVADGRVERGAMMGHTNQSNHPYI